MKIGTGRFGRKNETGYVGYRIGMIRSKACQQRSGTVRLNIKPARLGSAQLELAHYNNKLARLGSFASSSWLVQLVSRLEKNDSYSRATHQSWLV